MLTPSDADALLALEARLRQRLARVESAACFCAATGGICPVHAEADALAELLDELQAFATAPRPGRGAEGAD